MFDHSSNPAFNEKYFEQVMGHEEAMTESGTINKAGLLLLIMFCSATFTWKSTIQEGMINYNYMLIGLFCAFILSLIIIFYKKSAPVLAPVYAIFEGMTLGGISAMYNMLYQGIVMNAICITLAIFALMLTLYKLGFLRASETYMKVITIATGGIALGYLAELGLSCMGISTMKFLADSPYSILISGFIAVVAALNFVVDFEQIRVGVQNNQPKYMEWYCGFGLLLTLVWLYLEILKILAKSRRK